jgi:hypothetical protein
MGAPTVVARAVAKEVHDIVHACYCCEVSRCMQQAPDNSSSPEQLRLRQAPIQTQCLLLTPVTRPPINQPLSKGFKHQSL